MTAPFDYASLNYSEAPLRVLHVTLRNSCLVLCFPTQVTINS